MHLFFHIFLCFLFHIKVVGVSGEQGGGGGADKGR